MNIWLLPPFLRLCWRLWVALRTKDACYISIQEPHTTPYLCVFAARDREAWRVSKFAVETGVVRK